MCERGYSSAAERSAPDRLVQGSNPCALIFFRFGGGIGVRCGKGILDFVNLRILKKAKKVRISLQPILNQQMNEFQEVKLNEQSSKTNVYVDTVAPKII